MIPKKQKLTYHWETDANDNNLFKTFDKLIKEGWVIHQIIPFGSDGCYYLLLYKY